ncbi:MAG: cell division protein FtsH, partial [Syntrophomonadaceae bacterium]|nr:cell division protein FtsH [Syntrophomonadaceae bacterium]
AEALVLNDVSTGAQNDLERASSIVRKMITEYGMSEELGPLTYGHKSEEVFLGRDISRDRNYSDAIAYAIDKEANLIMENSYKKAEEILKNNLDKLDQIAQKLMEKETLEAEEFEAILKGNAESQGEPEKDESLEG